MGLVPSQAIGAESAGDRNQRRAPHSDFKGGHGASVCRAGVLHGFFCHPVCSLLWASHMAEGSTHEDRARAGRWR